MTEDDKELLRLAAKAYWGDEIDDVVSIELSEYENAILYTHDDNQDHNGNDVAMRWNPLEEDADAFRLMTKLQLHFESTDDYMVCYAGTVMSAQFTERVINGDRDTAARRAITRAASQIGEKML